MSYELVFWRQPRGASLDPATVYSAITEGLPDPGLLELPIDQWLRALTEQFPGARRAPNGAREWVEWVSADDSKSFQAEWSETHMQITCRYMSGEDMNRLVEIGAAFGCPLYDPQTGERFDSWTEN